MEPDRRLTAQGIERKQQLLDRRGGAVRGAGLRRDPRHRHRAGRPGSPRASSTGTSTTRRPCSRSSPRASASSCADSRALCSTPKRSLSSTCTGAPRRRSASWPSTPTSSRCSRWKVATSPTCSGRARASTSTTWCAWSRRANPTARSGRTIPSCSRCGVVGCVGHYSHFHRTGRITLPLPDLAAFVARYVVHSVAADESAVGAALAGIDGRRHRRPDPYCTRSATEGATRYVAVRSNRPLPGGPPWRSTRSCPMSGSRPPRRSAKRRPPGRRPPMR